MGVVIPIKKTAKPKAWFTLRDNKQEGPFTEAELVEFAGANRLSGQTPVWREGMAQWLPLGQTELADLIGVPPIETAPPKYVAKAAHKFVNPTTLIVAGLLIVVVVGGIAFFYFKSKAWSVSDGELGALEKVLTEKYCMGAYDCGNFRAEVFSTGTTQGKIAKLLRVKWTSNSLGRECSFVHYTYDSQWALLEKIITSTSGVSGNGECDIKGCFGCGDKTFNDVVRELGYTGELPAGS